MESAANFDPQRKPNHPLPLHSHKASVPCWAADAERQTTQKPGQKEISK